VHFLGIDWCARNYGGGGLESEQADLHDFPGGTWPWFTADITNCGKEFGENIVMVTHHPMHVAPVLPVEAGAFSTDEDNTVETFTSGFGGNVYANLAGHYHIDWHESRTLGQYEIYVTEATKLGADNFRLVKVFSDGSGFTYKHQKVIVPLNP
jgi:hypothetical protein